MRLQYLLGGLTSLLIGVGCQLVGGLAAQAAPYTYDGCRKADSAKETLDICTWILENDKKLTNVERANAHYERGLTYWKLLDYPKAIPDYDKAIELAGNFRGANMDSLADKLTCAYTAQFIASKKNSRRTLLSAKTIECADEGARSPISKTRPGRRE